MIQKVWSTKTDIRENVQFVWKNDEKCKYIYKENILEHGGPLGSQQNKKKYVFEDHPLLGGV